MLIEERIYQYSKDCPNKTAIISGEVSISYKMLWENIVRAASFLKNEIKLQSGDRIVISANKNIAFIYTYFGAHLNRNICVPIDSEVNPLRLQRIIDSSQPSCFIGEMHNCTDKIISFSEIINYQTTESVSFQEENSIADILFTTGTTGLPKGVQLTHKNLNAAVDNINQFIGNTSDDVELLALPVSHSFGLGRLRCVLSMGGTLALLGSFAAVKKFFGEIERCNVTGFGMVPASWAYLKKISGSRIGNYVSQLKYIEIGSAFMPLDDKILLSELLPQTRICMHYGLTEASRSAFLEFHAEKDYLQSIGKAVANTDIAIVDEAGKKLSAGQEGEICVKGSHVCSAYWGEDNQTFSNDFFDGYFRTGDWGYRDSSGYLYLKSRKKEMINVGGKKVSPIEVEEVLNQIDAIKESACVGVSDSVLGEVVKAFIICENGEISNETILAFLQTKLENYKIPTVIERIPEIPKTESGKIQRLLLTQSSTFPKI
ncbi:MAG: acyl--CoA ligase [Prevotellaceae bacterium]|jgi:long-chain acyl-CoA synthetase|nr:acyl--CoA ligase [Prevotellaceae bacterium]